MKKKVVDSKTKSIKTNDLNKKVSNNTNRSKSTPKIKENDSNYLVQSKDILNQQTLVLNKMEEIAKQLTSPKPISMHENEEDKDKIIESNIRLKLGLKLENARLKKERDALSMKNEQLLFLENKLNGFKLTFSDQATELMEHLKIINPRYIKNYSLLNPRNIEENQIAIFFKDIIENVKYLRSDVHDELQLNQEFVKREKINLQDELTSVQRKLKELDLVKEELSFYKRLCNNQRNELSSSLTDFKRKVNHSYLEPTSKIYERDYLSSSLSRDYRMSYHNEDINKRYEI